MTKIYLIICFIKFNLYYILLKCIYISKWTTISVLSITSLIIISCMRRHLHLRNMFDELMSCSIRCRKYLLKTLGNVRLITITETVSFIWNTEAHTYFDPHSDELTFLFSSSYKKIWNYFLQNFNWLNEVV